MKENSASEHGEVYMTTEFTLHGIEEPIYGGFGVHYSESVQRDE